MRHLILLTAVLVLALTCSAAFAQYLSAVNIPDNDIEPGISDARHMAMGGVGIALKGGAGVLNFNPALLASMWAPQDAEAGADWRWNAEGTYDFGGELNYWAVHLQGQNMEGQGVGASYHDTDEELGSWWMAGFGMPLSGEFAVGASYLDAGDLYDENSIINIGLFKKCMLGPDQKIYSGLTIEDLFQAIDEGDVSGPFFNLGVALPFKSDAGRTTVAADWLDITDEYESVINLGIEYKSMQGWALRGGLANGDILTAGAGFKAGEVQVDAAWQDAEEGDDPLVLSATIRF